MSEVTIVQADRVMAADFLISRQAEQQALDGKIDHNPLVQAFARHRQASTEDLVEALREAHFALKNSVQSWPDIERKVATALNKAGAL